jgi:hypothetical protein
MGARRVTMSRRQAMVQRLIAMAMQGDLKAFVVLLKLDPTAASDSAALEPEAKLSPEEAEMLQAFLKRAAGGEPEEAA